MMTDRKDRQPDPLLVDFRLVDNLVFETVMLAMMSRLEAGVAPDEAISAVLALAKRAWSSAKKMAEMSKAVEAMGLRTAK